jgi:2-dehydropantoate 2-reductase
MYDPLPHPPVIAVIGAGAVGAYYGGRLAQHGHDIHFLLRSDYQTVKNGGWRIRSVDGDFDLPAESLRVYNDARAMPKADLVIVTLKTTANDQLPELLRPIVGDDTLILTLQNGLGNEQTLADLFGPRNVLGGMAFVCINRLPGGVIHHISHGLIRIGEMVGEPTPRLLRIAGMFNASRVRCEAIGNLEAGRWEKLVWNIPFNGLGALLDLDTEALLSTAEGTALVTDLMQEVVTTATAGGHNLPADVIEMNIRRTRGMGPYQSSMQIDRKQSRPLEIESIIGHPLREARRLGVDTPCLRMLYRAIKTIAK